MTLASSYLHVGFLSYVAGGTSFLAEKKSSHQAPFESNDQIDRPDGLSFDVGGGKNATGIDA